MNLSAFKRNLVNYYRGQDVHGRIPNLSIQEAANLCSTPKDKIRLAVKRGELPCSGTGTIDPIDLALWIDAQFGFDPRRCVEQIGFSMERNCKCQTTNSQPSSLGNKEASRKWMPAKG